MPDPLDSYLPAWRNSLPEQLDPAKEERRLRVLIGELQAEGIPLPEAVKLASESLQTEQAERITRIEKRRRFAQLPPSEIPPLLPPSPNRLKFRRYSWRFFWAGLVVLGAAAGILILFALKPKEYAAQAEVQIEANTSAPTIDEIVAFATHDAFLRSIARDPQFSIRISEADVLEILRRGLEVRRHVGERIIYLKVWSTDRYLCAELANELADSLVLHYGGQVPKGDAASPRLERQADRDAAPSGIESRSPLRVIRSAETPITFARPDRAAFMTLFRLLAVTGFLLLTASYWFASASRRG